jgi:hypothetical protein
MHNYSVTRGQGCISPHSKTRLKLAAPVLCTDAGLIELCVTTQRDVLIETIAARSVCIKPDSTDKSGSRRTDGR